MNSLRLCKSFASALLLWPLLRSAFRLDQDRAVDLLAAGLALGLGGASLAALWERAAFTNVLDFSTDYRTTALFWEMHVGGAALDGFLALTVPFAFWQLRGKPGPLRFGLALALVALAAYACLTTFSRGVYLAIPIGLAVFGLLAMAQRGGGPGAMRVVSGGKAVVLIILAGAALYFVFRSGGYRAMLAFCATLAVALHVASTSRGIGFARMTAGVVHRLVIGSAGRVARAVAAQGSVRPVRHRFRRQRRTTDVASGRCRSTAGRRAVGTACLACFRCSGGCSGVGWQRCVPGQFDGSARSARTGCTQQCREEAVGSNGNSAAPSLAGDAGADCRYDRGICRRRLHGRPVRNVARRSRPAKAPLERRHWHVAWNGGLGVRQGLGSLPGQLISSAFLTAAPPAVIPCTSVTENASCR